ncbi:MAG TPA: DUF5698 domain-containing protein [Bacillota bacterium]
MWLPLLLIFTAQIAYVTMVTVRWILLLKGGRYIAAGLSFFEILLYVYTLSVVVTRLNNFWSIVVYALGYAVGSLVGTWIEGKIAYGTATIQVITPAGSCLPERLRQHGFAVTTWGARGRDAERLVALVFVRRRLRPRLLQLIDEIEPNAVVLDIEPRSIRRGFLARRVL